MAENYVPYDWTSGEPITLEKMRHIEYGILTAQTSANGAKATADSAVTAIGNMSETLASAAQTASNAENLAQAAMTATELGEKAWTQVRPVITIDESTGTVEKSLLSVLGDISTKIDTEVSSVRSVATSALDTVRLLNTEITGARNGQTDLNAELERMRGDISLNTGTISTINNDYITTKGNYGSLVQRLSVMDGNPAADDPKVTTLREAITAAGGRIGMLETEVTNARGDYADVDARLDAIESSAGTLDSNAVKYDDVKNNLTSTDTNKPLSAAMGKELKDTIGGVYNSSNTVASGITSAANTAEANAKNYADSIFGQGFDTTNTVAAAISALQNADTTLGNRTADLETEITDALTSSVIKTIIEEEDEETHEMVEREVNKKYNSVDERLEAIEAHAAAVRTDVNTIANELAMVDDVTHNIKDTNTKIDDLTTDVARLAEEISMGHDEFGRLSGAETRIDTLDANMVAVQTELNDARIQVGTDPETEAPIMSTLDQRLDSIDSDITDLSNAIDHTHDEDDPNDLLPDGLTQRITYLETEIDTPNTGISAKVSALDTIVNTLTTGLVDKVGALESTVNNATTGVAATALGLSNLAAKVNGLTVIVPEPVEGSNFTNNIPNSTAVPTPLTTVDYLIQNTDHKYYYWRYFGPAQDEGWQLISGAGNGGSGNTSGFTLTAEEYADIVENLSYTENTDYYVLESDDIYHHYRYIQYIDPEAEEGDEPTLVEIEIGLVIDPSVLKKYNIAVQSVTELEDNEDVVNTYLYLFDFNPNENVNITDAQVEERIANNQYVKRVKLPAGGGGGQVNLMKILQVTPVECVAAINNDEPTLLKFFFTTGEIGGRGYYNVTINGRKIYDNDILIQGGNPANAARVWPTKEVDGELVDMTLEEAQALGFFTIDVSEYCTQLRDYTIALEIRSETNSSITANAEWRLRIMNFLLLSSSPEGLIISTLETATIKYTPYGAIQKTLHIVIGGDTAHELTIPLGPSINGKEREYTIPAQTHGAHKIEMYMTAIASGNPITSDTITREYIWYNPNVSTPSIILASPLLNKTKTLSVYSDITIPYSVYNRNLTEYTVEYYYDYGTENQSLIGTDRLTGNAITSFTYTPTTPSATNEGGTIIPNKVTVKVGDVTLDVFLAITPISQDVSPVTGAIIDFDPALYNNNSINREPTWDQYSLKVSDNFNWSSNSKDSGGGYKDDEDGKCFVIKAGSYADINYKMFARNNGNTVFDTGAEIKIIFKTKAVRQADAVWFNNTSTLFNKTVGIQLNAHNGWLKTDKATDTDVKDTEEEYPTWESGKTDYIVNSSVVLYKNVLYKYVKKAKNFTLLTPDNEAMSSYWEGLTSEEWIEGTEYTKGTIVSAEGIIYRCVANVTDEATEIAPKDDTENTYWTAIISPWVSGTAYKKGYIVQALDNYYLCIANVDTNGLTIAPNNDSENKYWKQIIDWASGNNQSTTTYTKGSVVLYNDVLYLALDNIINQFTSLPKDLSKIWLKMGATLDTIIATNSYLYFPYSEDDRIELDININKYDAEAGTNFIMSYEDGVPSKAYAYKYGSGGDGLYHPSGSEANIRIGSPDCDVYIYKLRIYNKSLSDSDVLKNFIADGKTVKDKIDRYNRNCIYWDNYDFVLDKDNAELDPIKLAEKMPNVKVLMLDTPRFTTGKKDFVKGATLRCLQIQKNELGEFVYPDEGNWFFLNGLHAGQGTTSDNYGQSGRNVDFLFICDGKHWPTKEKNVKSALDINTPEGKKYISSVLRGNNASKWDTTTLTWIPTSVYDSEEEQWKPSDKLTSLELANWTVHIPETCDDWKGDKCKVALTPTSVPNNYFNLKVNIASSENVNNALFQKRYNDYVAYQSPAKQKQIVKHKTGYEAIGLDTDKITVKNSMEFVPAVLFIRENDPDTSTHTEFTDTNWHFYALGNIGDSKKTDYTRAYDPDDMNEFTVENSDNNTNNGQFQSGVYFKDNNKNVRYLETKYDSWSNKVAYKQGATVVYNNLIYVRTGANMEIPELAEGEEPDFEWVSADWNVQPITIGCDSLNIDWTANQLYKLDDIVLYNNQFYKYINLESSSDSSWVAEKWEATEVTYIEDDLIAHEGQLYRYIVDEVRARTTWIASDWAAVETKIAGMTFKNPMDYIYPITSEEWNIKYNGQYLNNRHFTLLDEEFDGDHSYEFRYACCGDYRDGDLINKSPGQDDDAQYIINLKVFYAFYEWVVTTSRANYRKEAPLWFVPEAMEFFYAYTHYYTMMDNRAKNTFWHFAETGKYYEVPHPVKDMYHVYMIANGEVTKNREGVCTGTFIKPSGEFDPTNTYYTLYAFDLWVYDTDTAAGIDNNGALIFPYGKEDGDYRVDGDPDSGYAFNGAGSIFWRRLKEHESKGGFEDGIKDVMTTAKNNCFDSLHLINEFDEFQADYPEEIWRLDIERKYIRTFTGINANHPYDNAVSTGKQNTRFLTAMMQGRKKYQRRQWIRDLGVYFQSKYKLPSIMNSHNEYSVTLGAAPESLEVPVDYTLKLTPYLDMYLNVVLGNGTPIEPKRAKAGVEYSITIPTSGSVQETRITIAGGDYLSGIGNLAPMYPYSLDFSHINHLKKFDMGTDEVGYINTKLAEQGIKSLGSGGGPLLEEVNVKNCHSLTDIPSLETSNNLRIVEATGTAITGIKLPDYTNIEILHLPNTIPTIGLTNAVKLKDFYMKNNLNEEDYNSLFELNVLNSDLSEAPLWEPFIKYQLGDIVLVDNDLCLCKKDHTSITSEAAEVTETWEAYKANNWKVWRESANKSVNWIDVALKMIEKNDPNVSISLEELSSATIKNILALIPLQEIKSDIEDHGGVLNLTGKIYIEDNWSKVEGKVYTNNIGYYTEENGQLVWKKVISPLEENDVPLWPELTLVIDPNKEQVKWPVTYRYNNTSKIEYVSNGAIAPEIYKEDGTGILTTMPTKDSTPIYTYRFGDRDSLSGKYIPYSGWKLSTSNAPLSSAPTIYGPTILDAYFTGIKRKYYVRWYLAPGKLIATSLLQEYGKGETLENPTIKDIHDAGFDTCSVSIDNNGMVSYSVFTGWDKLPVNIDPDGTSNYFDINGVWEERKGSQAISIGELFTDTTNLTPVLLLVLSQLTDTQKITYGLSDSIDISTCMTYKLGHDNTMSKYSGHVILADTATPVYLNGTDQQIYTSYQPLLANEDAFTFAIDYALNDVSYTAGKTYAILASCYHSANGVRNGFGIFKNLSYNTIEVGFGDMYRVDSLRKTIVNSTNSTMRNIIVLRHPKGESTLYIYSSLGETLTIPLNEPSYNSITRLGEAEFNSNAYLNIGTLINTNETVENTDGIRTNWVRAIGTVYWAKLWDEDLGIGECKRIASWPHESLTFGIAASYKNPNSEPNEHRAQDDIIPEPTLYLATRNTLTHGLVVLDKKNYSNFINNLYSWENSEVRTLCNNRLLYSLPTALQSILCKSAVETYPIEYYTEYDLQGNLLNSGYRRANYKIVTRDYLYAYSVANVLATSGDYATEETQLTRPFAWRIPSNILVYTYNSNNNQWRSVAYNPASDDGRGQYFNIRFPYINAFTGTNLRVFKTDDGSSITNIAESIGTDILKNGDIYIESSRAYIYVSNREINTYGLSGLLVNTHTKFNGISDAEVINIGGGAGKGGWIQAEDYWTRSLISNGTLYTVFSEVLQDGHVNQSEISYNSIGYKVNYILAI